MHAAPDGHDADGARLELAGLLIDRFVSTVPDTIDDLTEAHDHVEPIAASPLPDWENWWLAKATLADAYELLALATGDPTGFDRAIEIATELNRPPDCRTLIDIGRLRLRRYHATPGAVLERFPLVAPAVAELEQALDLFPDEDERIGAEVFLGLALTERVLAGLAAERPDHQEAARAIELITRNLEHLELADPFREAALRTLGDLHCFRHTTPALRGAADPAGELDLAIECYREATSDYGLDAAPDLVRTLTMRMYDRPDADDREEAMRWLERVVTSTDPADLDVEQAESLGQLLLHRATDDGTEQSALAAVAFLERAIDTVPAVSAILNTQLIEAYLFGDRMTADRLRRMIELLDTCADDPDWSDEDFVLGLRAAMVAELALVTGSEYASARKSLIEAAAVASDFDFAYLTLLGALGIVVAVEQGVGHHDPRWSPVRMADGFPAESRIALAAWLDERRPRLSPAADGYPEYVAAIALLRADAVPHDGSASDTRIAALRRSAGELESAADALSANDRLRLRVRRELGVQLGELGRATRSRTELRRAAEVLDEALGDMPVGHPLRTGTLAYFGNTILSARIHGDIDADLAHARAALVEATDDPATEPDVRARFLTVLGCLAAMTESPHRWDFGPGLEYLRRAVATLPEDHPTQALCRGALAAQLMARYIVVGDIRDLTTARGHCLMVLDQIRRGAADDQAGEADTLECLRMIDALRARAGHPVDADEPGDEPLPASLLAGATRALRAEQSGDIAAVRSAMAEIIAAAEALPADTLEYAATRAMVGFTLANLGCLERNRVRFDEGLAILAAQTDSADLSGIDKATLCCFTGFLWYAWCTVTSDPAALDTAIEHLERGLALVPSGTDFRGAARMYHQSAAIYWRRGRPGDIRRAVDLDLTGLRERARDVVLQTGTESALAIVADAGTQATALATRCLRLGLRSDAVRAAEAGKGLVLWAAAADADIAALLREHGHTDLAEEWLREQDPSADHGAGPVDGLAGQLGFGASVDVPGDLRHRVLAALTAGKAVGVLLELPSDKEIADALRAHDSDALVYLLPSPDTLPGRALIVSSDGEIADIALPALRDTDLDPLHAYVAARQAAEPVSAWHTALDLLCDWAGRVIDPLLAGLARFDFGRAPRIVLVSSGVLGVVPWHAARIGDGRRAVSELVFSYASSARQLCALAGRRRRPPNLSPVVVADPTGTLRAAPIEAAYVRTRYRRCAYLGVRPDGGPTDGRGDPDEVLDALLGYGVDSATMVHFACHAVSGPTPSTSYLKLADGAWLTVARIMALSAERPAGGLVVLAACQTSLTQAAHDEGLTLANAFIAAGATGVTGALWAIPDLASSVLMCRYHHELSQPGARPVDALRATQLWALDDERTVPADFPAALRPCLHRMDFRRPAIWAAFTHHGW